MERQPDPKIPAKRKFLNRFLCRILIISVIILGISCSRQTLERELINPKTYSLSTYLPAPEDAFMKLHLKDGNAIVFDEWDYAFSDSSFFGQGVILDANRDTVESGEFRRCKNDVVLIETNKITSNKNYAGLAVITGISVVVTIACLANPKACFGCCPTFYAFDGDTMRMECEAFSRAITPSMEYSDIDALYSFKPRGRFAELEVSNEAIESHFIRSNKMIAAKKPKNGRVYDDGNGRFLSAINFSYPENAFSEEGDILPKISKCDSDEWFSPADSTDLGKKEIVELNIRNNFNNPGLILASRQTLLTTYLFYQGLTYLGSRATDAIAMYERSKGNFGDGISEIDKLLGKIEVFQEINGEYKKIGETGEIGPICRDIKITQLQSSENENIKIRLKMTKGLWRIDYLAFAEITGETETVEIFPELILTDGLIDDKNLKALNNSDDYLMNLPGESRKLIYELPEDFNNYEYFLENSGYYLEWMRKEWIAGENLMKAGMMFMNPGEFLKAEAPEFKKYENEMEKMFWESRYVNP